MFGSLFGNAEKAMGGSFLQTSQNIFQPNTSQHMSRQPEEVPWLQGPQIPPMTMPWSVPSLQQPDLVRFTGENNLMPGGHLLHHKRKLEEPDVVRPTKQLITEEKMAAEFKDLSISSTNSRYNSNKKNSLPVCNTDCIQGNKLNNIANLMQPNDGEYPRLVISDEVKKVQQEPVIPDAFLSKLEKPTMALVLWQPPSNNLYNNVSSTVSCSEVTNEKENNKLFSNKDNSTNNNKEPLLNLNCDMGANDDSHISLEPMDL